MKMKNVIVGLIFSVMLLFSAASGIAQDQEGTNSEQRGEVQDSLKNSNILAFGDEEPEEEDNTIIVGLAGAAVLAAGGVFVVLRRRKKKAT